MYGAALTTPMLTPFWKNSTWATVPSESDGRSRDGDVSRGVQRSAVRRGGQRHGRRHVRLGRLHREVRAGRAAAGGGVGDGDGGAAGAEDGGRRDRDLKLRGGRAGQSRHRLSRRRSTALTPGRKPVPLMVSVKDGPPAVAEAGLRPVIVGAGLAVANVTDGGRGRVAAGVGAEDLVLVGRCPASGR